GATKRADAYTDYTVEVTFDHVRWSAINDGAFDHTAEVYGSFTADTFQSFGSRQLGNGGRVSTVTDWTADNVWSSKKVTVGPAFSFAQTPLPSPNLLEPPASSYAFNNNKMIVHIVAGDTLRLGIRLNDHDAASSDDHMCNLFAQLRFSDTQL